MLAKVASVIPSCCQQRSFFVCLIDCLSFFLFCLFVSLFVSYLPNITAHETKPEGGFMALLAGEFMCQQLVRARIRAIALSRGKMRRYCCCQVLLFIAVFLF